MRFIVYGAGAVGGVVGGRMFQHGHDVVLVARGEHREAIATNGLTVEWPEGSATLPVPVVEHPAELSFGDGDVVLVAVKSQDTEGVLDALSAVAPPSTPIVCLQNGVANEVAALRRFANVHGVTVMAPTWHLEPGVVQSYTPNATAMLDVGRWPHGTDSVTEAVAAAFVASGFESIARADIARWKYTKLLLNLGNPVDALCPRDADAAELVKLARREGLEVLAAAGNRPRQRGRGRGPAGRRAAHRADRPAPPAGRLDLAEPGPRARRSRSTTSTARSSCSAASTTSRPRSTSCSSTPPTAPPPRARPLGHSPQPSFSRPSVDPIRGFAAPEGFRPGGGSGNPPVT